jgi:hypothetical protein
MYITLKIAQFKLSIATKDEYLTPFNEVLLCKKGFRFSIGNYVYGSKKLWMGA